MEKTQDGDVVLAKDEPLPESLKPGDLNDNDSIVFWERYWDQTPDRRDRRDKMHRDFRVQLLLSRAAGHPIGITKWPALYAKFPELAVLENAAEAMYKARQVCGVPAPPSWVRSEAT